MKKLNAFSQALPFYLLAAGVFLLIVCQDILSNGMFLDGLIYSTVSKNLSDHSGRDKNKIEDRYTIIN
jgi:hypothetical protein